MATGSSSGYWLLEGLISKLFRRLLRGLLRGLLEGRHKVLRVRLLSPETEKAANSAKVAQIPLPEVWFPQDQDERIENTVGKREN